MSARLLAALVAIRPYLDEIEDQGPAGEGWQSRELIAAIAEVDAAIEEAAAAAKERDEVTITLRVWGDDQPTAAKLATELERIAGQVRDDFTSGEAMQDEDFAGNGWWNLEGDLAEVAS